MKLITLKQNERLIKKVALALGELNDKVVYVGGAVIGFYVDDPAAENVKNYLKNEFLLISDTKYKEVFFGHLYYQTQIERYNMIMEKLSQILKVIVLKN